MTSLLDIEKRLVAAEGADRELEGDIFFLLDPDFPSGTVLHMSAAPDPATFATGAYTSVKAPAYLSSVDAAIAFAERVLPGQEWGVNSRSHAIVAGIRAEAATPALSLCLATIRALIAQKGNTDA